MLLTDNEQNSLLCRNKSVGPIVAMGNDVSPESLLPCIHCLRLLTGAKSRKTTGLSQCQVSPL